MKHATHTGYGTWKNFELRPLYRPWDLEEFRTSPPVLELELSRAERGASRRI